MGRKKRLSATLISNLNNDDECPFKVKSLYIDKTHRSVPSKAMLMGLFFEQEILGTKPGTEPIVVPKLKNLSASTDELRVLDQAKFVKDEIFKQYDIRLEDENTMSFKRFELDFPDDNLMIVGEFDMLCDITDPANGRTNAIVDLKLTKNINYEDINNKAWSWRYPQNRDHTQAYMYYYAYKHLFPDRPDPGFFYLVCDYKPTPEHKMLKKKVDYLHMQELKQSINKSIQLIDEYDENGWPYKPSFKNCNYCPLKATCSMAVLKRPIEEF